MAQQQPSYTNVFIPGFDANTTTKLIVDYSRNWKDFQVNNLATQQTVELPQGFYQRINPAYLGRVDARTNYMFADGAPRPIQSNNMYEFDNVLYNTQRLSYDAPLGYQTKAYSVVDQVSLLTNGLANKAMTQRAKYFYSVLGNSANHLATHITSATSLVGGLWSASTASSRLIQQSLMAAARTIIQDTMNGGVGLSDLWLVLSPQAADMMARTPEISDYTAHSYVAGDVLQFKWAQQTALYGLPATLYGMKVVVDEGVQENARIGETDSKAFFPTYNTAYIITKANSLQSASAGTQSFSSMQFFIEKMYEMKIETHEEVLHQRSIITLTDSWDCQLVSRESAFVITGIS